MNIENYDDITIEKAKRRTDTILNHIVGNVQGKLGGLLEAREEQVELVLARLDRLLVEAGPHYHVDISVLRWQQAEAQHE